jgi:hypothetical protein
MIRFARTYGSTFYPEEINKAWIYPTGPLADTFGVPVSNKTFGLEEFNFNPHYLKSKIAYVPCYATERCYPRPSNVKELRLIYKTVGRCHVHYATLYNVQPILDNEISNFRNQIDPLMNEIYFGNNSRDFFESGFDEFGRIIDTMRNSLVIAANHIHSPFLVNVRYDELLLHENHILVDVNPSNVNQWKINVQIPGNCR